LIFLDPVLVSFEPVMLQNLAKIIEIFIKTMQTLNLKCPDANDLSHTSFLARFMKN